MTIIDTEICPCSICGQPTTYAATKLCDPCWHGLRGIETIVERTTGETRAIARDLLGRLTELREKNKCVSYDPIASAGQALGRTYAIPPELHLVRQWIDALPESERAEVVGPLDASNVKLHLGGLYYTAAELHAIVAVMRHHGAADPVQLKLLLADREKRAKSEAEKDKRIADLEGAADSTDDDATITRQQAARIGELERRNAKLERQAGRLDTQEEKDARIAELESTQREIAEAKDVEAEQVRWQRHVEALIRLQGLEPCDASDCDSGDPLDWSSAQLRHAFGELEGRIPSGDGPHTLATWRQRALSTQRELDECRAKVAECKVERNQANSERGSAEIDLIEARQELAAARASYQRMREGYPPTQAQLATGEAVSRLTEKCARQRRELRRLNRDIRLIVDEQERLRIVADHAGEMYRTAQAALNRSYKNECDLRSRITAAESARAELGATVERWRPVIECARKMHTCWTHEAEQSLARAVFAMERAEKEPAK